MNNKDLLHEIRTELVDLGVSDYAIEVSTASEDTTTGKLDSLFGLLIEAIRSNTRLQNEVVRFMNSG